MHCYLSFDLPKDKIIWDVGHQSYTHKILKRAYEDEFDELRQYGGISGFPKRKESAYDAFRYGTQLHLHFRRTWHCPGPGYPRVKHIDNAVVSVIGDGASYRRHGI